MATLGAEAAPDAPGVVLGRYRLGRRLGSGGFGVVWEARDERLDRPVAVKVIPREGGRRAEREARAAARLNHPGIVTLYESGADADATYLVSELVSGRTLGDAIEDGALSDRDVLVIGAALCDALGHAHAQGVIHRDVKPQNVILPAAGTATAVAKLTDFGVASLLGAERLTRTSDVVGTLAYMAPEQAEGRPAGEAADVYALALVLYEALAGVNPVRASGPAATARRLGAVLPSLRRLRRDLPAELCEALDHAVRPEPDARGSLEDLRSALEGTLPEADDEPGTVTPGLVERTAARAAVLSERRGPRVPLRLPLRVQAGLGAGGLCLLGVLAPVPGEAAPAAAVGSWLAAAGVVAVAVALLPRLGWLAAATAGVGWLAFGPVAQPGAAVLVAVALAPVPLLLPRAPWLWSAPALAPLLAVPGLAGAFPALAGQPRTALRRAALGAVGVWWLVLSELLLARDLLFGRPAGTPGPEAWQGDPAEALADALLPALSVVPAAAALWAGAALVLPWLARGRSLPAAVVGVVAWSISLAVGTVAVGDGLHAGGGALDPEVVAGGAALAGLLALAGLAVRARAAASRVP